MENLLGSSWLFKRLFSLCLPLNLLLVSLSGCSGMYYFVRVRVAHFLFELVRVKGQTYHTIIYLYQQLLVILSLAYYFVLVLVYCAFDYINVLNEMLHHHYHPSYSWQ